MRRIKLVAHLAGVSTATVSRVFSETVPVRPATREKVLQAAEKVGYQPDALARALRVGSSKTIGLLLPNTANHMVARLMTVIEDQVYRRGYRLIVCNTADDPERERIHLQELVGRRVDGLIVSSSGVSAREYRIFLTEGTPIVALDRRCADLRIDGAYPDNAGATFEAVSYLLRLGHCRIAAIGPRGTNIGRERFAGYHKALATSGVILDPRWQIELSEARPDVEPPLRTLLNLPPGRRPSAIIALSYAYTQPLVGALRALKLKVPDELSLVVYGDTGWNELVDPPLTAVVYDGAILGGDAVELLFRRQQQPRAPRKELMTPGRLVIGASCACPAAGPFGSKCNRLHERTT